MKKQKLIHVNLEWLDDDSDELAQEYLNEGWEIVSYQVCPKCTGFDHNFAYSGDVVILLEKEEID